MRACVRACVRLSVNYVSCRMAISLNPIHVFYPVHLEIRYNNICCFNVDHKNNGECSKLGLKIHLFTEHYTCTDLFNTLNTVLTVIN